jgi:hypothetical protein
MASIPVEQQALVVLNREQSLHFHQAHTCILYPVSCILNPVAESCILYLVFCIFSFFPFDLSTF